MPHIFKFDPMHGGSYSSTRVKNQPKTNKRTNEQPNGVSSECLENSSIMDFSGVLHLFFLAQSYWTRTSCMSALVFHEHNLPFYPKIVFAICIKIHGFTRLMALWNLPILATIQFKSHAFVDRYIYIGTRHVCAYAIQIIVNVRQYFDFSPVIREFQSIKCNVPSIWNSFEKFA